MLAAAAGLAAARPVLIAVVAALLARDQETRKHTLQVLAILMHSPRQLTDDKPPAPPPAVEDSTSLPKGRPRRWFLTAFASGTGVKNHGSGNRRSSASRGR